MSIDKYTHIVCEGVDGIGKSSLIQEIKNQLGFRNVIHFSKPENLKFYKDYKDPILAYQYESFKQLMLMLQQKEVPFIFDRSHIGEFVYGPMYRNYDGGFVFDLEHQYLANQWDHVKLVVLTTSFWSVIKDDGESFDFSRKEEEQISFVKALDKSLIPNKQWIDIIDLHGNRKTPKQLFEEIL